MAKSLAERVLPKYIIDGVLRTIEPYLRLRAKGDRVCSAKMRTERRQFILLMVAELWELGYRIRKLESLSSKHVETLMAYWHEKGIVAGTLHTRLSMIKVLCSWLGKFNVVKGITAYLPAEEVRRHTVAKVSKAWDAKDIDPLTIIQLAKQIDERLAVMLAMQHYFGLRVKESIELRPANAVVDGGRMLEIHEGTKGGRVRRVPIKSDQQREIIAWARQVAESGNTKRLRWPDCTFTQAQGRFYHYVRNRLGISGKTAGVTPHGLRHGYAQRAYEEETGGLPSPIKGGAIGRIERETHRAASITVSRALGHGRIDVTTSYYGSYGHALRQDPVSMTYTFKPISMPSTDKQSKEKKKDGNGVCTFC
ncbi:tyrosine-type recombinase/integrase [Sulfuricystis multivorans]|uniref:tyrosine-type recombinase/integrase n=1 Tax=Sulfuricystis multivorans TaxID=2211108 RepID=UPI000F822B83|nr:integrase domain-containing protein [Sulfuricystis multivorans]